MLVKNKKNAFLQNLSWIFFGNVLHAVFSFLLNIYVARSLSQYDYGIINYSISLIAFASSFCSLGLTSVITKKFADDIDNASSYIKTSIVLRLIIAFISIGVLQFFLIASKETLNVRMVVFIHSIGVLFSAFDIFVYWFRFDNKAKTEAIIRFISFVFSALWRTIVLLTNSSLFLYMAGVISESFIFGLLLLIKYCRNQKQPSTFSKNLAKKMLSISYPFIFSAILVTIYAQTDKMMLNSMLSKEAVAEYSVAVTLAGAISIIPTSLIEGFRPDIMKYKGDNERLYIRRLSQLYALVFWLCVAYCLFITLFSEPLILLIYGEKYINASNSLSLIVWYTSFSYFGAINNLFMVAENKTKWVQVLTLIGAVCNIVLNLMLIPTFGVVGAAIASLITQIVTNFLLLAVIPPLKQNFYIILKSIFLKNVLY